MQNGSRTIVASATPALIPTDCSYDRESSESHVSGAEQ